MLSRSISSNQKCTLRYALCNPDSWLYCVVCSSLYDESTLDFSLVPFCESVLLPNLEGSLVMTLDLEFVCESVLLPDLEMGVCFTS